MKFFGHDCPGFDDETAREVAAELIEMSRPQDPVILEREQAQIAATSGMLAREFLGGHSVAQMHEDVADYWIKRLGMKGFLEEGVPYLAKHHPTTAMKYQPAKTTVRVQGRRGRWGLAPISG